MESDRLNATQSVLALMNLEVKAAPLPRVSLSLAPGHHDDRGRFRF